LPGYSNDATLTAGLSVDDDILGSGGRTLPCDTHSTDLPDIQLDKHVSMKFPHMWGNRLLGSGFDTDLSGSGDALSREEHELVILTPPQELRTLLDGPASSEGEGYVGYGNHMHQAPANADTTLCNDDAKVITEEDDKSDVSSETTTSSVFASLSSEVLNRPFTGKTISRSSYGSDEMMSSLGGPPSPQLRRESNFSEGYQSMVATPVTKDPEFYFPCPAGENATYGLTTLTSLSNCSNSSRHNVGSNKDYINISSDIKKVTFEFS
jgi:hypothetical protein